MQILDRYILRQVVGPFVFFVIVFGVLFWLNSALRIISFVAENGQSGGVFLQFAGLLVPRSVQLVFGVSAFAAAIYLANHLYVSSELVVMQNAGRSPLRILTGFGLFGAICFVILSALVHVVTPLTTNILNTEQNKIREALISQISKKGRFIALDDTLTIYIGDIDDNGTLYDVFIDDESAEDQRLTYVSSSGRFITEGEALRLRLEDGSTHVLDKKSDRLTVLDFDSFTYDLSNMRDELKTLAQPIEGVSSYALIKGGNGFEKGKTRAELHGRLSTTLFAFLAPIFGALAIFSSRYNRRGYTLTLYTTSLVFIMLEALRGNLERLVVGERLPESMTYLTIVLLMLLCIALHVKNTKRRQAAPK